MSGRGQNLERAQDALPVAHVEARGGLGIARRKLGVKLGRGPPFGFAPHGGAHRFRRRRYVRQAIGQGAEIKPGAAGENDRILTNLAENLACGPRPSSGREIDRAVDCAEQAMGASRSSSRVGRAVRILRSL